MKFKEIYPLLDKSKVIELYDEYTEDLIGIYNSESADFLVGMEDLEVTAIHTNHYYEDTDPETDNYIKTKYCIYLSSICNKIAKDMVYRIQDIEKRHENTTQSISIDLKIYRKNTKKIFNKSYHYLMDFRMDLFDSSSDLNKAIRRFENSDYICCDFNYNDKTDLIYNSSCRYYNLKYII